MNPKRTNDWKIWKIYIRSFISSFSFVAFFVTFIVLLAQITKKIDILVSEITLAALIFGIWNMIYLFIRRKGKEIHLGLWGALLGFLFGFVSLIRQETHIQHNESISILLNNIFNPEKFNFVFHTLSIIWLPLLYFILWNYFIKWMNNLWRCEC